MKITQESGNKRDEDMLPEYDIDYSKSRPNRFADKYQNSQTVIRLESDVAKVFPDSESVNAALRFLIRVTSENQPPLEIRK